MSIFGDIGNIAKGVVNTVEHAAGDVAKVGGELVNAGEQVAGGLMKAGEGVIGQLIEHSPAGEAFGVFKNIAGGLLGEITGHKNCPTAPAGGTDGTDGANGGGSIYDKIFALLAKLQDKLNSKVDAASKVDPSDQAGLQKAMFEVQQIQSQMTELVTTATNLLKTQHDTQMSEVRNFA